MLLFNSTTWRPRPRSRLRHAVLGVVLVLCVVSFTAILWDGEEVRPTPSFSGRRGLAYLDAEPPITRPYGRIKIDENYQSLLHPSNIDSSLFRKKKSRPGAGAPRDKGYADGDSSCDDALLFLPHSYAHGGHAAQLNNYLLAAMVATFTNRAMIVLEAPPEFNEFKSNSQFGCPPEAYETEVIRAGGVTRNIGWKEDFPTGLTRLIKHPVWLSRGCPVPCQGSHKYEDWDELRMENNVTVHPEPQEVTCANDNGRESNVIVMGGRQVRDYFWEHYKDMVIDRNVDPASLDLSAASTLRMNHEWALRLGAAQHEARIFTGLRDRQEIWDYASAFLARAGLMRFHNWIARDVEEYVKNTGLPLDVPYDAIHVRRGDMLERDGKRFVEKYWGGLEENGLGWWLGKVIPSFGRLRDEGKAVRKDYIPFAEYLRQFDDANCVPWREARVVYIATDDPAEVQKEIEEMPKDDDGRTILADGTCVKFPQKFEFHFGPFDQSMGFHLQTGLTVKKEPCETRYARAVAGIADLAILAKSDTFVGEFNSNWGRLVRVFRLKFKDDEQLTAGARPVEVRKMKVAWGPRHPGPPGW